MLFLQELLAIQQQGPRSIGFFGTRNMGFMHQELIEILSYALVITVRCINFSPVHFNFTCGMWVLIEHVSSLLKLSLNL